jgi:hypothetical protein
MAGGVNKAQVIVLWPWDASFFSQEVYVDGGYSPGFKQGGHGHSDLSGAPTGAASPGKTVAFWAVNHLMASDEVMMASS